MFIRSQDKEKFGDYKEVFVVNASIMGTVAHKDVTKLGDYKSNEKALDIVDNIQHEIAQHINRYGSTNIIYEMPESEEGEKFEQNKN